MGGLPDSISRGYIICVQAWQGSVMGGPSDCSIISGVTMVTNLLCCMLQ